MPIDMFYLPSSPPCWAVMLLAKKLNIELNLKTTDLMKQENKKPEFLKVNPQHAVPAINDNGLGLGESRAILSYFANQYDKDGSLYPKDPKKRAIVDQRLYFDIGTLYQSFANYYLVPLMTTGKTGEQVYLDKLEDAFGILNKILEGQNWVAGDSVTIADYSIVASVTAIETVGFDVNKFPNVSKWYAKSQKTLVGYNEILGDGSKILKGWFKSLIK